MLTEIRYMNIFRSFWDVFYIDATSQETLSTGLTKLAKAANTEETPEGALAWLVSQKERWLVVFNNADDPSINLHQYFPRCSHGNILITTRNQQMAAHTRGSGSHHHVSAMLPEEALKLLMKTSGVDESEDEVRLAATLVEVSISVQGVRAELKMSQHFGYFALATVQAGAYIRATQCGLSRYLQLFLTSRDRMLQDRHVSQAGDYEWPVYASWELSYRHIPPRASQLLHMLSFMHHEGISESFFEVASTRDISYQPYIPPTTAQRNTKAVVSRFLSSLRSTSNAWDPVALKDLINTLRSFSLLDYDPISATYSMHPLVHSWCRTIDPGVETTSERTAWVLALCINWEFDSDNYTLRRMLLPHVLALGSDFSQMALDIPHRLSLVYQEAGLVKEAESLRELVVQAGKDRLGRGHPVTLSLMHNLAATYMSQERWKEAEVLHMEVLEIRKQVLGADHPDTLKSMHELAFTYKNQNRWREAEVLQEEVIEATARVLGVEHVETLVSVGELASTYWSQGRLSEAESLYAEVLEVMKRVLGIHHPSTVIGMHSLAATYKKQGKLRDAERLMAETVELYKQVRGEQDPETQKSIEYLASIQRQIQAEL